MDSDNYQKRNLVSAIKPKSVKRNVGNLDSNWTIWICQKMSSKKKKDWSLFKNVQESDWKEIISGHNKLH